MGPEASRAAQGPSRIVIADDHPLFRSAIRHTLQRHYDHLEVVAEAADGREAVELCRRLRPDLVLMDVRMPKMDGLTATRALKGEFPRTPVLVLTAAEDPGCLTEALRAGAAGYVLKCASRDQLVGATRRVLEGESSLDQNLAARLLRRLAVEQPPERGSVDSFPGPSGEQQARRSLPASLTAREAEVLGLIGGGHTNQRIARELFISVSTVKKHVRQVLSKLGVSDRTQAALRAVELGLGPSVMDGRGRSSCVVSVR